MFHSLWEGLRQYHFAILLGRATRPSNVCENVRGYVPYQSMYGRSGLEDIGIERFYHRMCLMGGNRTADFTNLMHMRQRAEEAYRRGKAL